KLEFQVWNLVPFRAIGQAGLTIIVFFFNRHPPFPFVLEELLGNAGIQFFGFPRSYIAEAVWSSVGDRSLPLFSSILDTGIGLAKLGWYLAWFRGCLDPS
ncbi:hypothetical protein, partial [Ralstonia solanacearum]|uniref:hypothetical protein n=1 Tax=Ralstonia solanacearum TaxID=305 RepID=UPI0019D3C50C